MSWVALGWASQQRPGRVADKMVLIALADRHNEESGVSYPSVAWLAEFSCLDRKTVVASLDRLEAAGLIADSGLRTGKTKQVKAYTLNLNGTEKGVPETVPFEAKSTAFSGKQSQKRDTEPSLEPSLPSETTSPPVVTARDEFPVPAGCDPVDWASLLKTRKAAHKPMTEGAYRQITKKFDTWERAGWPPGPILANAVERGWLTVFETDEMKGSANGKVRSNGFSSGPRPVGRPVDPAIAYLTDKLGLSDPAPPSERREAGSGAGGGGHALARPRSGY